MRNSSGCGSESLEEAKAAKRYSRRDWLSATLGQEGASLGAGQSYLRAI